jgi:GxxExxY protein
MLHDHVTERIIAAAMSVHSALGPGLLESTYHACLDSEMSDQGLQFDRQVRLPIVYRTVTLEPGYRIDFLVENCVVVELKAVEKLLPLHSEQVLSYLKLSGRQVGLLLNFNTVHLRQGIRRFVNGYGVASGNELPSASSVSSVVKS